MTATQPLPRSQVPLHETWNLDRLFVNFEDWEKAFAALPTEQEIEAQISDRFLGRLSSSPEVIRNVLEERNKLRRHLLNLYVYAGLRNAEDVGDSQSTSAQARIHAKFSSLMAAFAFVEPELLQVPQLAEWKKIEPLKTYEFELSELLREKAHVLTDAEEKLLAKLSPVFSQFSSIHTKWNNVDLTFPDALDSKGHNYPLSHGRYSQLTSHPDRILRQSAFENLHHEIAKQRNTIAANFNARLLSGSLLAKARNYTGFRQSQLSPDNIPEEVYDNLLKEVRSNLDALHRSMDLRKKVLGIDVVQPFDRRVTLNRSEHNPTYSFSEARELILASLEPMGSEYIEVAKRGLGPERWVDYAENKGKRAGAFSWGTFDSNPVIHMTWTGTLDNVFTLAHELGHSMHSYLSNKTQPYHLSSYTIFVAEVASTLNEGLLSSYMLKKFAGTEVEQHILSQLLEGFEGTVLRQVLFAAFERDSAQKIDEGQHLGPDEFDALFESLNKEWYNSDLHPMVKHEWMRIPHFYSTFYVYKYATSYCASQSLLQSLLTDPEKTRQKILSLLTAGGSKSPLDILLDAGVDFMTPDPVRNAFSLYRASIVAAEKAFLTGPMAGP